MAGYKQGKYKLKHPEKYLGDANNIVFRSGWEKLVMKWLDENPNVNKWSSEEVIIPYISPIDNKTHRYFPDFYVEAVDVSGNPITYLIEVKPHKQTMEPRQRKKKTKQYVQEVMTWGVNKAKWTAAKDFCRKKGWDFRLLTENQLFKQDK